MRRKQRRGKGGEVSTQAGMKILVAVAPGASYCYAFLRCAARSRTPSPSSFSAFPTGAQMKLSINYKHVESHKPVESEVERHVSKLEKLLRSYSPDLEAQVKKHQAKLRKDYEWRRKRPLPHVEALS